MTRRALFASLFAAPLAAVAATTKPTLFEIGAYPSYFTVPLDAAPCKCYVVQADGTLRAI